MVIGKVHLSASSSGTFTDARILNRRWLLRRFGTLVAFQPILLGLIFLANEIWIEGGVLAGTGVGVIIFVEIYTSWKTRQPGRSSLSAITRDSLATFADTAKRNVPVDEDDESNMMSQTLAVMPSSSHNRGLVPLQTETLDDLTATERAARTHPDAPPHLPPLPLTDHAEDMAGILYAPELIAPPPMIWLPHDSAGTCTKSSKVKTVTCYVPTFPNTVITSQGHFYRRQAGVQIPLNE
ncbi:hypothetical protein CPB85DRAFT_1557866 [Mucidula mucida]|nr:hypothetical protein CPB85DRAFT_1557866 [Mucidula mucida]